MISTPIQKPLQQILSHDFLQTIRELWLGLKPGAAELVVPKSGTTLCQSFQYISSNPALVNELRSKLEALRSLEPNGNDIVKAASPHTAYDWVDIIVLLVHIPRCCLYKPLDGVTRHLFDDVALDISTQAISKGIPEQGAVRYQLAIRRWFYLPLQYSVDERHTSLLRQEYAKMFWQAEMLIQEPPLKENAYTTFCRGVLITETHRLVSWEASALAYRGTKTEYTA